MNSPNGILALIPARGGSKGIPGKNIRPLGGVPLVAYSIAAARQSTKVNRVIVSTDDAQIAEMARLWGAEVPFLRPEALSGDLVEDFPVFEHTVQWLEHNEGYRPEVIVQLRPTSPFRPPGLVDYALECLLSNPGADSIRAVTPSGENPYKMWQMTGGKLAPILASGLPEAYNMPRQALPATYWQTGHLDAMRLGTILDKRSLTGEVVLPALVPHEYAMDLDNPVQWAYAEYVLEHFGLDIVRPSAGQVPHPRHKSPLH